MYAVAMANVTSSERFPERENIMDKIPKRTVSTMFMVANWRDSFLITFSRLITAKALSADASL